jgi:iron complex outermembrane recepter protein
MLRLVPGLVASQHSGEGKAQQLFLRGFDAVHGQDIELNVAGLPVNEVSHIHALGYADLNWLIPATVREVKVAEGSSRASQGDFAVAGTVRYELGLDEPGIHLSGSYGSFNRRRLFAGFRPNGFNEDTFVAVEYVQGDGFGASRAFGRLSLLGQLVLNVGDVKLRGVIASYGSRFASPGVVPRADFLSGKAKFFDSYGARQGGSTDRHQLLLGVEIPHSAGRSTVEAFGVLSDLRLRNNFTGFIDNVAGDGLEQVNNDLFLGAHALHRRHLHVRSLTFGVELGLGARHDRIHQTQRGYRESDATPLDSQIDATITQTTANAFTEVSLTWDKWRFMLGGRMDVLHFNVLDALAYDNPRFFSGTGATRSAFGVHWGLKAGVERRLGEHFRLFLNYGDGFRSPQARSLADGERAPFVSIRTAEVGAGFDMAKLSARLVAFGSSVDNDFFFDQSVGTTVFTGATLRGGVQANVTATPLENFLVSASFTYAHASILGTRSLLPYFAPLVGRLDASYRYPFKWLGDTWTPRVGAGITFIGPRPLPYDEYSNAVALVDARLGLRWRWIELVFDVQNVLDSQWRDGEFVYSSRWDNSQAVSVIPARHFTAGPPRTLLVTLEVHL